MAEKKKEMGAAEGSRTFSLREPFPPAGDQPNAIKSLGEGLAAGLERQTVLGVTGSGKTYTLAHVIANYGKPTLIMAPNKTLAAQLYAEFRDFFPDNAVEYFVSYYDYYQPEAYVPAKDLFIEKDSAINEHIEQMRLSATKTLLERRDAIIVATVSAIYGLGSPESYHDMILSLRKGTRISRSEMLRKLVGMQYSRADMEFKRGTFRVRGDTIDIFPAEHSKDAVRVDLFGDEVDRLSLLDALTGKILGDIPRFNVYPATHYAIPESELKGAIGRIREELTSRLKDLRGKGKAIEAARLETRTNFDLEMLEEGGFCKGIENYSRHLSGKAEGEPPATLFDYLPKDALLVLDESHIMIPQIGGMSRGDRARKENLVDFGFRLPSALDNRPLNFAEFEQRMPKAIYVSATPAEYEKNTSQKTVELVARPTGVLDPEIEIRPAQTQIDDLLGEIKQSIGKGWRVLVTSLTKKMAEKVSEFLVEQGIKAKYLHSDIDNIERVELIRGLRKGDFDVLVGINLLREGLDMPEVARVAILDADKEGFLRSARSLIQTIGRAARNPHGKAILYADKITKSMEEAIGETNRRREKQREHNEKFGITPSAAKSEIKDLIDGVFGAEKGKGGKKKSAEKNDESELGEEALAALGENPKKLGKMIADLEKKMREDAKNLRFEEAAAARDRIAGLKKLALQNPL